MQDILEKINTALTQLGLTMNLVLDEPVPMFAVDKSVDIRSIRAFRDALFVPMVEAASRLSGRRQIPSFRSVDSDRLDYILEHGCDVDPTDATMFVSTLGKALEYGGFNKVIQIFDGSRLRSTFKEVNSDMDAAELEELRKTYPTAVKSTDGSRLWLSRLDENDRRLGTGYEIEYARYIPGDPWEVLLGLILVGFEQ